LTLPLIDAATHQRHGCRVAGLIGPGDRKSVQPMAERLAPGDYDQLHHFVAAGVLDSAPLETELLIQADRLIGGSDALLVMTTPHYRRRASTRSVSLRNMLQPWARTPTARRWYP
jgi:hypothetical protein